MDEIDVASYGEGFHHGGYDVQRSSEGSGTLAVPKGHPRGVHPEKFINSFFGHGTGVVEMGIFLKGNDGERVPSLGQATNVRAYLRLPQGIEESVVGQVENMGHKTPRVIGTGGSLTAFVEY